MKVSGGTPPTFVLDEPLSNYNIDNELLVCNVSWVYSLFFSQQSIEKPEDRTKI